MTNEKRLLDRAGFRGLDALLRQVAPEPGVLTEVITHAREVLRLAV